ncbi:hypothetical protein CXG81DRAFT_17894 [Caulochytrium protostelioides]|uniref:G-patch domain-containing protein n=1 Tax=Caulochytrium protostelioides TaxID=1555241 RepID=A0A4P9XBE7_9FUNG|nr:hypothetical protein CXG81DRAFT_17894 [Caulochytrium protostelioides]|eukprot:RKP02450.1 hypothetical protein CXG81DRAFT_17894 [Caulochytrium protostelioides]
MWSSAPASRSSPGPSTVSVPVRLGVPLLPPQGSRSAHARGPIRELHPFDAAAAAGELVTPHQGRHAAKRRRDGLRGHDADTDADDDDAPFVPAMFHSSVHDPDRRNRRLSQDPKPSLTPSARLMDEIDQQNEDATFLQGLFRSATTIQPADPSVFASSPCTHAEALPSGWHHALTVEAPSVPNEPRPALQFGHLLLSRLGWRPGQAVGAPERTGFKGPDGRDLYRIASEVPDDGSAGAAAIHDLDRHRPRLAGLGYVPILHATPARLTETHPTDRRAALGVSLSARSRRANESDSDGIDDDLRGGESPLRQPRFDRLVAADPLLPQGPRQLIRSDNPSLPLPGLQAVPDSVVFVTTGVLTLADIPALSVPGPAPGPAPATTTVRNPELTVAESTTVLFAAWLTAALAAQPPGASGAPPSMHTLFSWNDPESSPVQTSSTRLTERFRSAAVLDPSPAKPAWMRPEDMDRDYDGGDTGDGAIPATGIAADEPPAVLVAPRILPGRVTTPLVPPATRLVCRRLGIPFQRGRGAASVSALLSGSSAAVTAAAPPMPATAPEPAAPLPPRPPLAVFQSVFDADTPWEDLLDEAASPTAWPTPAPRAGPDALESGRARTGPRAPPQVRFVRRAARPADDGVAPHPSPAAASARRLSRARREASASTATGTVIRGTSGAARRAGPRQPLARLSFLDADSEMNAIETTKPTETTETIAQETEATVAAVDLAAEPHARPGISGDHAGPASLDVPGELVMVPTNGLPRRSHRMTAADFF